jgi:hypothetical protein
MDTNDRRVWTERRKLFRVFNFFERRALGRERRLDAADVWGEPIPTWQAAPPLPEHRTYPAEI